MATSDKMILDIDGHLQRIKERGYGLKHVRNRIYRVGVELEGGWSQLPSGVNLVRDGSINFPQERRETANYNELVALQRQMDVAATAAEVTRLRARYRDVERLFQAEQVQVGELPSDPMELDKLPVWMKKFYPQKVNESCGLHVHMSFKTAFHYQRLMIPQFPCTIVAYLTRWAKDENLESSHPIWGRLKGDSEFCQPVFDPDRQARRLKKEYNRHEPGNRYTMINFCFGTHGTLECRLLPMMDNADRGIRAVQRVIDITNACLVSRNREERYKGEVIVDPNDDVYRENRVEVI